MAKQGLGVRVLQLIGQSKTNDSGPSLDGKCGKKAETLTFVGKLDNPDAVANTQLS